MMKVLIIIIQSLGFVNFVDAVKALALWQSFSNARPHPGVLC